MNDSEMKADGISFSLKQYLKSKDFFRYHVVPPLRSIRKQVKRILRLANEKILKYLKPSFWAQFGIRHLWRRPIWYTDKYGVTLRLYPGDCMAYTFANRIHYDDEAVIRLTRKLITPGMAVVDVGANHGQFACLAAQLVGETGRVDAFEPTSYSFQRLKENIGHTDGLIQRLHTHQMALGNRIGQATLYVFPDKNSVWNSLHCHSMKSILPAKTESVKVITLDKYCREHNIEQINLLKVDVEGFEAEVLQGCERMIKDGRIQNVIFEIAREPLRGMGKSPEEILQTISDMNLDIFCIHSEHHLEKVDLSQFKAPFFANYLATPRKN